MATQSVLKVKHALSQSLKINFIMLLLFRVLAYLMVLTVDASHITVAEENRPGTPAR
jgi:hypothetical protein